MMSKIETLPPDRLAGFDYASAHHEDWALLECCDLTDQPTVQLQALDRDALLSGVVTLLREDGDAWALVMTKARQGSVLHRDALTRIDDVERVFGPL